MIRTAIIGLGKMGMSHCAILGSHPDVEVVGVCDTDSLIQSAFTKLTKIPFYTDYTTMLDRERPDAVYVVTPTRMHCEMVTRSLERGCHVFCEKPFSLTPVEGERMVDLAARAGVVNQVGYVNRFVGTFNEMRRLLKAGVIGKPFHFTGENYGPVVLKRKGGTWRSDHRSGGGCLMDYAAHILDLIDYVFDTPIASCRGTFMPSVFSSEVEDGVYSTLRLSNGLQGQLAVNWSDATHRKATTSLKIEGDGGKLECDTTTLKIFVTAARPDEGLERGWNIRHLTDYAPQVFFNLRGEEFSLENDHFVQCILSNDATGNRSSFASALHTDRIIEQLINDAKP